MKEIEKHIQQIISICEALGIKSLHAFGSVVSQRFSSESDIDLVVDIDERDPLVYSSKYFELKFGLEEVFKRKIDLLESKAIKNKHLKIEIDRTKLQIYGE